jgi:hypothetical protein
MAIVRSATHDPDLRRTDMTKQSNRGTALITGASAGIGARLVSGRTTGPIALLVQRGDTALYVALAGN